MPNPLKGALMAFSLAIAALPASAAIVYVDKNSAGPTHDGKTWQTACTTILTGYTLAKAGDEVWVGPGTYSESITLKPNVSLYGGFVGYEFFRDQRVGIQGITTLSVGTQTGAAAVTAIGTTITPATVLDGFTFTRTTTTKTSSGAVMCTTSSPTISHNVFAGLVSTTGSPINCSGGAPVITNNIISACSGAGTRITDRGVPAISLASATGIISNNTIVGNGGYAISGSGSPLVVNNIVAYNAGGISITPYQGGATYRNNCLYGNLTLTNNYPLPTDPTGANGNITADPKFAVYAYGNLHIAPDSPCRDAGDDSAVAPGDTDIDLGPRVQGTHVDIGADESDGRVWTFHPRIVRVSPTGNDANDGSNWALAKKTIQAGIDLASQYGGDVWVQSGTYALTTTTGPILLKPFCYLYGGFSGTEAALYQRDWMSNPTIISAQKTAILTATSGFRVSSLDGFYVTGGASTTEGAANLSCFGASPYIRNNVFTRNAGPVVQCTYSGALLTNNGFYNNAVTSSSYVVGGLSSTLTVIGNVFSGNGPASTAPSMGSVYCDKSSTFVVANNLFEGNSLAATTIPYPVSGVQGQGTIANNTFVNNRGVAIDMLAGTAVNNIVAFNDTGILTTPVTKVLSNCTYGNTANYVNTNRAGKDGNISVYPMFNNLVEGDYRLMDTSPCVDAGRDSFVTPGELDLDGLTRIQGRAVDMGCYESSAYSMIARWGDIARALRIAGGLAAANATDIALIHNDTGKGDGIGVADATTLIRRLSGGVQ